MTRRCFTPSDLACAVNAIHQRKCVVTNTYVATFVAIEPVECIYVLCSEHTLFKLHFGVSESVYVVDVLMSMLYL